MFELFWPGLILDGYSMERLPAKLSTVVRGSCLVAPGGSSKSLEDPGREPEQHTSEFFKGTSGLLRLK